MWVTTAVTVRPGQAQALSSQHPDRDDLAASITELQNLLLAASSTEEFLQELAVLAARTIAANVSCGITLEPGGQPLTVATSDQRAAQVDEVQYGLGQGPCLHSMRTSQRMHIEDTAGEQRWGGFSVRAAAKGIRSSLSLPLAADGIAGALNLYAPVPRAFGEADIRRAEVFAASASGALALAARQATTAALTSDLRAALASRSVIDQALGIIMAQERCTSARAFAIVRAASQNRNVKLRDIARQIVTSVSGEPPQPPPFDQ
jgi:GAF domain-containing protein